MRLVGGVGLDWEGDEERYLSCGALCVQEIRELVVLGVAMHCGECVRYLSSLPCKLRV